MTESAKKDTPPPELAWINEALEEKKGMDISILDLRERASVTDYFVIVSGTSAPHLKALSVSVQQALKAHGVQVYKRSDDHEAGWMVLDYVDVVVHIFERESREYYGLEELWTDAGQAEQAAQGAQAESD